MCLLSILSVLILLGVVVIDCLSLMLFLVVRFMVVGVSVVSVVVIVDTECFVVCGLADAVVVVCVVGV